VADYELTSSEMEVLEEVCRGLDTLDALHAAVARDGTTIVGSTGSTRLHPAIAEARSMGLAVARLLAQLGLPDEAGVQLLTGLSVRSQKGNQARWGASAAEREKFRNG
jgi:phage terminase small subunit